MSRRSKFARSRVNALKHYAEQLMLPHLPEPAGEPHKIITCCKCGKAKGYYVRSQGDKIKVKFWGDTDWDFMEVNSKDVVKVG